MSGIVFLIFVAGAAGACSRLASTTPSPVARELGDVFVTANLRAVGPGSGVGGTVRVVDLPGTEDMQIQVEATGLPPGEHAWHIHSGSCAQPGEIVVPFTSVGQMRGVDEPIEIEANGRGEESAPIPGSLLTEARLRSSAYSVHIHAQPGMNPGARIACADLR